MAEGTAKNPGRLGILLLLSLLAAFSLILIVSFSCDTEKSSSNGTIASEAAVPEVDDASGRSGTGNGTGMQPAVGEAATPSGAGILTSAGQLSGERGTIVPGGQGGALPPAPGRIYGSVRGETASPLDGIVVYFFLPDGSPAGFSANAAAGAFSSQVAPGQYKLFFSDPGGVFESAWYGGYGPGSAAVVTVGSGQQVYVAQTLSRKVPAGGSIAGTVKDDGGANVAGVNVFAFLFIEVNCATSTCGTIELKGTAVTAQDGSYRINGLDTGSYKVMFSPTDGRLALQWYREQSTNATAKTVAVEKGKTAADIDALLYGGGTISGTISRQGGGPAAYAMVDVYDGTGVIVYSGITDGNGNYRTSPLPEGEYRVHAATNMPGGWKDEWYNGAYDFASADAVTVSRGSNHAGVDIEIDDNTLPPSGQGDGGVIIVVGEQGVVEGAAAPGGVDAGSSDEVAVSSANSSAFDEGPGDVVLSHENEHQVGGNRGDDQSPVGQVEGDQPPSA